MDHSKQCMYNSTSERGHSEKGTHSLEWTNLQVPIENPMLIYCIANLLEATTWTPLNSRQQTVKCDYTL